MPPDPVAGYYAFCGDIAEFKTCDGQPPQAVLFSQEVEDAYGRLGLNACENAFVRFKLGPLPDPRGHTGTPPGYVVWHRSEKRKALWNGPGPTRSIVYVSELLAIEPASQHPECKAVVSDIDQIRALVEDTKPLLAEATKRNLFATEYWLAECNTSVSDHWDLLNVKSESVNVHIQAYSQCRDKAGKEEGPFTGDDNLVLQKEGQVWRRKPSMFLGETQKRP